MKALYIHVPFCVKKCAYCDFVSFPGMDQDTIDRYVDAVCEECRAREEFLSGGISTLFFGGGTPSLLSPFNVERIFSAIKHACPQFPDRQEITLEANPGTVDVNKLKEFKTLGINRISLGVQSLDNRLLEILGRVHTAQQAMDAYSYCRTAGFDNVSLDLMFALPSQTITDWENDIRNAVSLAPEHLSIYNLQVEEDTPMWEKRYSAQAGEKLVFPGEEEDAEMYLFAKRFLQQNKYSRYEISNFALEGKECRHNLAYWENRDYLGLGVAAHSCINGKRWANTSTLKNYLVCPAESVVEARLSTAFSRRQETLFLGLRLSGGVETGLFEGFEKDVEELLGDRLIEEKDGRYRLTEQGVLLGNRVFSRFV